MKALLKWIFITLFSLVALLAIGIGVLLFVIDPNEYKPQIEQLAKQQNIELNINGDLGWQIFPGLAITVGDTTLSGAELPSVAFKQASLSLSLKQLLGGQLAIHKVAIDEPLIRIDLAAENASEQIAATAAAPVAAASAETPDNSTIALNIESLQINNGTLELLQSGQLQQRFEMLNISGQQLNFSQQPFPLAIALQGAIPGVAESAQVALSTQAKLDSHFQQITLASTDLTLKISSGTLGNHELTAKFDAVVDLAKDQAELPTANITLDGVPLTLSANIQQLTDSPAISGKLNIPVFAPQPLLEKFAVAPESIPVKQLALSTEISINESKYQLNNLALAMDGFKLNGQLSANFGEQNNVLAKLSGNQLNLDSYLPDTAQSGTSTANSQPEALFAPLLAPLAMLNGGSGQVEINLQQLIASGTQLDNIHLNATSTGSIIKLTDLSANGFGGNVSSNARIDLSKSTPTLQINLAAKTIDVGAALSQLADFRDLSGRGDLTFTGATQGNSSEELTNNLKGTGTFALNQPVYSAENIEQLFCSVAGDRKAQITWPKGTQFDNATGQFQLQPGQILQLNPFNTGVGNIKLSGNGAMVLPSNMLDMKLVFNIKGAYSSGNETEPSGCKLRSKSIQNRDIPVRLKGSVDNLNAMLTNALLELMAKMVVEDKAGKLLDKFLGTEKESTSTDEESTTPETDSKDALKGLLKDLLKKR